MKVNVHTPVILQLVKSDQGNEMLFYKLVKRAPDLLPVSRASLNFFIGTKRQYCVLYPFRNLH